MGQIVFVQVGDLCQTVQGDVLPVVGVQIPLDLYTLPAVRPWRFFHLQRERCAAYQPDQQHLQQVLTDGFAAIQTAVGFGKQHMQQSDHSFPVFTAVEDSIRRISLAE